MVEYVEQIQRMLILAVTSIAILNVQFTTSHSAG